jgi:hypothetical protein
MSRVLHQVVSYLWLCDNGYVVRVPKDEYWDGSLVVIDGNTSEPDAEELACGHEQPVRVGRLRGGGRGKYYNNRRRCDACAALGGMLA